MTDAVVKLRVGGRILRGSIVLAYCVAAVCGIQRISSRPDTALSKAYVALRNLPEGHLIGSADFKPNALPAYAQAELESLPAVVGRYLPHAVSARGSINPEELTDLPRVKIAPGLFALPFSAPPALISLGLLDVNSKVSVCAATCEAVNVQVATTLCDKGASVCSVILEVTESQAQAIASHPADQERLVVTPKP